VWPRLVVVLQEFLDEHRTVLPVQFHDFPFFCGQSSHIYNFTISFFSSDLRQYLYPLAK
jgi:hypothetical protein